MRILIIMIAVLLGWCDVHAQTQANEQVTFALLTENRRLLQSRFSTCQAKIYKAPELAPAEAQLEMEQINKEIDRLAKDLATFEQNRFSVWNSEQYWTVNLKSGKKMSYWSSGPSARYVIEKLKAQMDKAASFQVAIAGPFKRADLNTSQQLLDAIRNALGFDADIQRMAKQFLNK